MRVFELDSEPQVLGMSHVLPASCVTWSSWGGMKWHLGKQERACASSSLTPLLKPFMLSVMCVK